MILSAGNFPTDKRGWAELLPARAPCPAIRGNRRVHFAVIGAGVTGLACARRLAELHPGKEILLVEARMVGQGASGRNSGFAVAVSQFSGPFKADQVAEYRRVNRLNQAGLDLLREQVAALGIDCQWHEGGFHHAAADQTAQTQCAGFRHYLEALDIPHTPLDRDTLHGRLGTTLYREGVHVSNGVLLHPAALVRGLADGLPANVTLAEHSPVLRIESGDQPSLRLPGGLITADALFIAANFEAAKLGFLRRRLIGSTLAGSFTRVLAEAELASLGSLHEWGVLSLHGGGATVRLTADRRLCLRNTAEYHGGALLSDTQLEHRQHIHRAAFEKRFPQLAHVPFEYAWSGVEGISRNATNFFGRQRENIFLAGGFNGSGVSRGTAFGTALAEFAGGGQSPLITDCLACTPGAWIPPRPFLDMGAFMTVRSRFRGVGLDR